MRLLKKKNKGPLKRDQHGTKGIAAIMKQKFVKELLKILILQRKVVESTLLRNIKEECYMEMNS